jgi:Ca2+/H+ antiporter, TMEM165/GDT1 family
MTTQSWLLALTVFGACTVEMVEALTLVVASGTSRGWRSAIEGTLAALGVLAVAVAVLGASVLRYVPLDALRVIVGALLLTIGMPWLRKAWLRASGHLPLHDEDAIYAAMVARLGGGATSRRDAAGFLVAFKGVLLEGSEVVVIVLSLGATQHRLALASAAAGVALVLVTVVGALVARQLSNVPENSIKLVVGVLLTSFGVFWVGEGAKVRWPGGEWFLLALLGGFVALSVAAIAWLRASAPASAAAAT